MRSYAFFLLAVAATASAAAINSRQPGNLLEEAADSDSENLENFVEGAADLDTEDPNIFPQFVYGETAKSLPLGVLIKQGVEYTIKCLVDLGEVAKTVTTPADTEKIIEALDEAIYPYMALSNLMEGQIFPDRQLVVSTEEYQTAKPVLEGLVSTTKETMGKVLAKKEDMVQDPKLLGRVANSVLQLRFSTGLFSEDLGQMLSDEDAEGAINTVNPALVPIDELYATLKAALGPDYKENGLGWPVREADVYQEGGEEAED